MFMLSLAVMALQTCAPALVLAGRRSDHFKPTIRLTKDKPREVKLTVLDGKRVVWRAELGSNYEACVFPNDRTVVYFVEHKGLMARRFDGTTVWRLHFTSRTTQILFASGNFILVSGFGPTPGAISPVAEKLQAFGRAIIDVHTGKQLWGETAYSVGTPCWMNDGVFVATRDDLVSQQAKEEDQENADYPTWIEVRRVRDRTLLWQRHFKGNRCNEPLQRVNTRQLKFCYAPSIGNSMARSHPRSRTILVPVRRRRAEAHEQSPILYSVPSDS